VAATPSPLETFMAALPGGRKVGGQFMFNCPSHRDLHPSLAVREREPGGTLLVFDHGGCRTEDVLDALGFTLGDLYPSDR
jgi:hypothetical protein